MHFENWGRSASDNGDIQGPIHKQREASYFAKTLGNNGGVQKS